jgi:Protein of unknown function (DUF2778)
MWNFKQSTGQMRDAGGKEIAVGWAGQREGKNNPTMQGVAGVGPLPQGQYTIGEPHESPHTGPYTMDLTPDPSNNMLGRSVFRIHGAAFEHPELSSEGCIIMPRYVREMIWNSGDHTIEVVA